MKQNGFLLFIRQQDGRLEITWWDFGFYRQMFFAFCNIKFKSKDYVQRWEHRLTPKVDWLIGNDCVFL